MAVGWTNQAPLILSRRGLRLARQTQGLREHHPQRSKSPAATHQPIAPASGCCYTPALMSRSLALALALTAGGLLVLPSTTFAEPHGNEHTSQPAGPAGGRPDGVDYGDTTRQQANRGGGGGCAGCAVQGSGASAPAAWLALGALALWVRRRGR